MKVSPPPAVAERLLLVCSLIGSFFLAQHMATSLRYSVPVAPDHELSIWDKGIPGFASDGSGCVRSGADIYSFDSQRQYRALDFDRAARVAINRDVMKGRWDGFWDQGMMVDTSVVFDRSGTAYTLVVPRDSNMERAALLWSSDHCRSWQAAALTGRAAMMEKPGPFSPREGPPTIVSFENYGAHTGPRLWLDLFERSDDGIARSTSGALLAADDNALGSNHSGGGNATFTSGGKIALVYASNDTSAEGTLGMARQFDLATMEWSGPAQAIARSSSKQPADPHATPSIAPTPSGTFIVAIGGHQSPILLFRSRRPHDVTTGWISEGAVGAPDSGPQFHEYTYPSLDIARDGTINIIARAEAGGRFKLVQFRRRPGGDWRRWDRKGSPHRVLVMPDRGGYGAWRHRTSMGPDGELFLNFSYYANNLTESEARQLGIFDGQRTSCREGRCWYIDAPTQPSRTLHSDDDGLHWK
ncbi:BNR-4 repeat-containing protein [Stakelama tenebrarum]|uniref:Exo-alpha-sialidase n=1 Tax=Stakelama tenebrarum TaxID=2711215 RepID=A0A6G6Y3P1_9SPHN|nr:BNR-4 repeat-containing protein [Sphingosinithalassobacter tenebrarum]QIG79520.1 hypothetical protein G5C33_06785 [Sphingosinithalassobacter tenebrarum]